MNDFVIQYPAVIISMLAAMVGIISWLLAALFLSFKKSIDNVERTMCAAIAEIRSDRKQDRVHLEGLLDRMQRQETICMETQRHCPMHRRDNQA